MAQTTTTMTFDFAEISQNDSIKLNFLRDILDGKIELAFQLDGAQSEDYAGSVRSEQSGGRLKVYGNFNISEDPSGEVLSVRVVMIEKSLKIKFSFGTHENFSGKKISVFRKATKSIEKEYGITNLTKQIELVPNSQGYLIKISAEPENPLSLQNELNEIKSQAEADETVIKYYDDNNNTQKIREILNDIKTKLSDAENQLRTLIEAKENKTMQIESEIK